MLSQWMSPWINKRRTDKVLSSGSGFKKEQTSSCRNPPMSMNKWIGCGPEISKKSWEIPSESTSFYGPPKEILGEYIETTLTHINYSNWIAFVCNWVALAYFDYSNWVDQQLLESWTTHRRQLTCDGQILETVSSSAQTSSRWFATLESFWQTQKPTTTGISVHTNHVAQQTTPSSSAEDCANKLLLISLQILVMAFDPVKIIAIKMR